MATLSEKQVDTGLLITGVPLVLLARAANIFPLSYLLNMKGESPFQLFANQPQRIAAYGHA